MYELQKGDNLGCVLLIINILILYLVQKFIEITLFESIPVGCLYPQPVFLYKQVVHICSTERDYTVLFSERFLIPLEVNTYYFDIIDLEGI